MESMEEALSAVVDGSEYNSAIDAMSLSTLDPAPVHQPRRPRPRSSVHLHSQTFLISLCILPLHIGLAAWSDLDVKELVCFVAQS